MRAIVFSVVAIISFQCRSSFEIKGVWLHTTTLKNKGGQISNYGRQIFNFENDSVTMTSLGNQDKTNLSLNEDLIGTFKTLKNRLLIETDKDKIRAKVTYSSDSLILVVPKFNRDKLILKKLQDGDKCEIQKEQFINKSFRLSILNYSDSIFFLNDTIMLHCGNLDLARPEEKWKLTNHQGFKFFLTSDPFIPGMIVSNYTDSTISLSTYVNSNINLKLTDISSPSKDKLLIGEWIETERKLVTDVPNRYDDFPDFGKFKVEIDVDKIYITQYGRNQIMKWKTTPDFSRIYFLTENSPFIGHGKLLRQVIQSLN